MAPALGDLLETLSDSFVSDALRGRLESLGRELDQLLFIDRTVCSATLVAEQTGWPGGQTAVRPPSTGRTAPCTKLDRSPAR